MTDKEYDFPETFDDALADEELDVAEFEDEKEPGMARRRPKRANGNIAG